MMRDALTFCAIAVVVVAMARIPVGAVQAPDDAIIEEVDVLMTKAAQEGFGGAVVIERQGRMLLSKGYGLANRQTRTAFTSDTIAPISSITKSFTALALVQLAAEGKIDLRARVRAYLATAAEPAASARLSDVLVHHAGLGEYCGDDFVRRTKAEMIAMCTAQPLGATPGTYAYSNSGYSILAAIVEEASGRTWEDYLGSHVFGPARMTRSGWMFPDRTGLVFAEGYLHDQPRGVEADRVATFQGETWNLKGNGGLQASASDMYRYYRFLMQQPDSVRELMTTPHADESDGVKVGYGLAFRMDRMNRPWRIGHSGSDGVFLSYFMWLPQQETFMYFVGNNGEEHVRPVLVAVLTAIQNGVGAGP